MRFENSVAEVLWTALRDPAFRPDQEKFDPPGHVGPFVTISFALDVEIGEEPLLLDLIREAESHTGIQCRDEDIRLYDDGAEEYEPTVGVVLFENSGVVKIEVYDASEVSAYHDRVDSIDEFYPEDAAEHHRRIMEMGTEPPDSGSDEE